MLLLNTEGKMDIIETNDVNIAHFNLDDSIFDWKFLEVKRYIHSLIDEIEYDNNVVIKLNFTNTPKEEAIEYVDQLVEIIVDGLILDEVEEKVWQPRTALVERIAATINSQIKLINHNVKFKNFTIQALYNEEKIYEMIE